MSVHVRLVRAVARLRLAWIAVVIVVGIAVLGVLAWPRVFGGAKQPVVTFTTTAGATIEIEGRSVGTATDGTLTVGDLEIGRVYLVVARLDGYEPKQAVIRPHAGTNEQVLELRVPTTVELDSKPPGATVEIGGRALGSTPMTLTSLTPGATVSIKFKRIGYRTATARVEVPSVGHHKQLTQELELSDEFVRVHFVSDPPGAAILRDGQRLTVDRTYTPADVFVEANQAQHFTLIMPKHVPLVIPPFTPGRDATVLEKGGALVEGTTLRIEATLAGKVTVSGVPHCKELVLPVDCTLAPGSYVVDYLDSDNTKQITHTVIVAGRDAVEKFDVGIIQAGPGMLLQPGGLRKGVVETGTHTVTVSSAQGTGSHSTTVTVKSGATVVAN